MAQHILKNITEYTKVLSSIYSILFYFCLFIKEGECTYKPELAAAFVKNVVNITAVGQLWKQWFLGLSVGRIE